MKGKITSKGSIPALALFRVMAAGGDKLTRRGSITPMALLGNAIARRMTGSASSRRRSGGLAVVLATISAMALGGDAQADTLTAKTFTYVGHEETFTVSSGVTSVRIEALGAPGGAGFNVSGQVASLGGVGGRAVGEAAVSPGQILRVYVGGTGLSGGDGIAGAGGFNGGGAGSLYGGGGGGASDVRTDPSLSSRLVIAAGGGGGAFRSGTPVTNGGSADQSGGSIDGKCTGGAAGTTVAGGAGGTTGGQPGSLGKGGAGGVDAGPGGNTGGGGGGGGLYGGGGGGVTTDQGASTNKAFCSGGGGANGFGAAVTNISVGAASTPAPSVTITELTSTATPTSSVTTPSPTQTTMPMTVLPLLDKPAAAGLRVVSVRRGGPVRGVATVGYNRSALRATLVFRSANGKRITVGSTLRAPVTAGVVRFAVKLNIRGRALLKKRGRLRLSLVVTVTPPEGATTKLTKTLTLRR